MEREKSLIVQKTKNGQGVFANKDFKNGEMIFGFHGKIFTYEELPVPYNDVEDHFVQIDTDLYMGPLW